MLHENFFWKKSLTSISSIYWPLSFCKIFKKILRANPELWGCTIFGLKIAQFVLNKIFWYKPLSLLSSTFSLGKIFKNSYSKSRVMRMHHFWSPKWSICPKKIFLKNIISNYLLAPFVVLNFKKILPADPELWGCASFGPRIAHLAK